MYRSMLEAANEIYAEYISSGENIMEVAQKPTLIKLKNVIESVKKEHFGITSNQYANAILFSDKDTISYANIHSEDDERFSFGLFFIPKGGFLPLHDHPNMFVFSKILMGKVKRLSFSLTNRNIQFEYPHQITLQKLYIQQQQQQLLLQQRQIMAQKQQQVQLLQQQNPQIAINGANLLNNNNNNINNFNNNMINSNGSHSPATNNLAKKHSSSQLQKVQMMEPSGQRTHQGLNDAVSKDFQSQGFKQQQQQQQQQITNNQNYGGLKGQSSNSSRSNNNSASDISTMIGSGSSISGKNLNNQISSSPNLMEQSEKAHHEGGSLNNNSNFSNFNNNNNNNYNNQKKNGIHNGNNGNGQQSNYQNQQQQQLQQQQQYQQQQYQQQQQQLAQKKLPDLMNLIQPQLVEAILDSEEILSEGFIDDLDPFHKNLHYIEAVEDCVFFDVLLPHYDLKRRYCNYYNILRAPDPESGKTILSISNQPTNQNKVQYFTIEKSTCDYFN